MKVFDRHRRLTAEALKAGYAERGSNPNDTASWRIRWSNGNLSYLIEWWGVEGLRSFTAGTLPAARYAVQQLVAGKKPTYAQATPNTGDE